MSGRTYEGGQISYEKLYIFDEENRDIPSSAKSAMIQAMEQNDPVGIVAGYYDEKLTILKRIPGCPSTSRSAHTANC